MSLDMRNTKDVLFYVFQCAKSDRMAFADCVTGEERERTLKEISAFENLQKRIFGTKDSRLDAEVSKMKKFSIFKLKEFLESNPEIFTHMEGCKCEHCKTTVR